MQQKEVTLEDAYNMALGHMQQGNFRVAALILQDIIKSQPEHHDSHYMLSLAHYHMGDLPGAMEIIQKALEADDAEAEWWCNYGIMLNEARHYDEAINAYDKAIEIDTNYPNGHWNKAHTLWLLGKYDESEQAARIGVEKDPKSAEAWLNLGTAVVKLGRLEEAAEYWEKALEIRPDFAFAWNNLGNALRDMGRLEESEEKCRKALELDPSYAQAMNNLGNVLLDQGKIEDAEAQYRQAITHQPDYAEAHNNLSICLIRQHRHEEAILHGRYAISFKPDYVDAFINLSLAFRSIGKMEDAEKAIQKAVHLKPDSAEAHIDLADVLFMQDRYGDAEIELQKAQELKPDSPRVYIKLSNVLERGNKIEEALKAVDKAVELNPEMPEAFMRKGNICHISNRIEEAETYFKKALEMRPALPVALISLAELYQSLGEMDKSLEYIEKAQELAPDIPALYHTLGKTKKFTEDDPQFQKMVELEKTVDKFGLDQAAMLNFALFSAYENIKDYDKAFEHLKKGNDFKRKLIPYESERQKENFGAVKKNYNPDTLAAFKDKGYDSDIPVFIVGMPRSGTTLTEQIISSHPDVFGAGELSELSDTDLELGPLNTNNAARHGERYVEQVKKRDKSGNAKRITDKMPGNFASIGKIVSILPNAKIIHCRRNPIDTCLSCYKQNFARGQYWSYNMEELGTYYNEYLDLMAYWREVLKDRFIEIDYETTVSELEKQARMLIDYVELPWNEACLEPHKQKRAVLTASKTQVIQPVYKSSMKGWKRYEKQLQPLIDSLSKGPAKDLLDL